MRNQAVARRRKVMYGFSVLMILVVGATYIALLMMTNNVDQKAIAVNERITNLDAQLKNREPLGKNITAFKSRLVNMQNLLDNHVSWSKILGEVEKLMLPNVRVTSLKAGLDTKSFELAVLTPDVGAAADLLVSLQDQTGKNDTYFVNVESTGLFPSTGEDKNTPVGGFVSTYKFKAKDGAFLANMEKEQVPAQTPEPSTTPNILIPEV